MNLQDPIVAFIAESNVEAAQVAHLLAGEHIDAHAEEDLSVVGLWAFGKLSQVHQPRVWISRRDEVAASSVLSEYERRKVARTKPRVAGDEPDIEVVCEDCGKTSSFAARFDGTTQECRHCRAHIDVGEFEWPFEPQMDFTDEE